MPEPLLRTIGKSVVRKEGIPKITGQAIYADDIRIDNCLYGRTVRSTVPHGLIKQIRFNPEFAWRDFTIVLPDDIPGKNAVTLIDTEQPFLAQREIQHRAVQIGAIAHADKVQLERALGQIEVDVEELPAVFTMEEALARNEIFKSYRIESADPSQSWRLADLIVEGTYRTGSQEHLYI